MSAKKIPIRILYLYNLKENDLYAVFLHTQDKDKFECYSIVGQHSTCSLEYINQSVEAGFNEYQDLHKELTQTYHNFELVVVNNTPIVLSDLIDIIHSTIIKYLGVNDIILDELKSIDDKIKSNKLTNYAVNGLSLWKSMLNTFLSKKLIKQSHNINV